MTDLFFDYHLPEHLIAQHPAERRDESRLLVLDRAADSISHHRFRDLPRFLKPNDLLVLNDTKVIPARVVGVRANTGGRWEGLFLREVNGAWEMLAQTRGYPEVGETFVCEAALTPRPPLPRAPSGSGGEGEEEAPSVSPSPPPSLRGTWERGPGGEGCLILTLVGRTDDRHWLMTPDPPGPAADLLAAHGHIPLPPYIRKGTSVDADKERYQTVYAEHVGSVAAPTAGLHFTPELLNELTSRGVNTARVTLHVGLGTFAPVKADDPTKHQIHAEWAEVSAGTAEAISRTKAGGGRVVAVGTTTTRTLETAVRSPRPWGRGAGGEGAAESNEPTPGVRPSATRPLTPNPSPPGERGTIHPFRGETALFIHPPFKFRALDALVTNFHLPRTTLLLLVQAFSGSELLRRAYEEAIREEYRFFSYGDAMLIV